MRIRLIPLALVAALTILCTVKARAQDNKVWIGKRVFTKYGTVLMVGDRIVDDEGRRTFSAIGSGCRIVRVYRVEQAHAPWLWIVGENGSPRGWVRADRLIPLEQAVDYFTAELKDNPSSAEYYNSRGLAWAEKGQHGQAIGDFTAAIRLDPQVSMMTLSNRGRSWKSMGEYDKAIGDYSEAIRIDPSCVAAYNGRAIVWRLKGEYDKAIADYSEWIRIDPRYNIAYYNRAIAWNLKGEHGKAIADYSEAIRIGPEFSSAYYNRGLVRKSNGEYDKAIADYNEAIRVDPKCNDAYCSRAWLWATCPIETYRDGKHAVESARAACDLSGWTKACEIDGLAAAYAEVGEFDSAVKYQEMALPLYVKEEDRAEGRAMLELFRAKKPYREVARVATRNP